jgi:hypothetical protein
VQGAFRLWYQHHAEPGQHTVDARVRQVELLRVHDPELDVGEAAGFGAAASGVDHPR